MVDLAGLKDFPQTAPRAQSVPLPSMKEQPLVLFGLFGVVLLGVGLRLIPVIFVPSINWADEIFQTIEPAHRLVYGYGIVPWEFQLGMRSWLLPGVIAGLIELSRLIGDGPAYYLPTIAAAFALLASAPVVCCFLWCRRWYGLPAALVGATVVATAPELVYFGARTLSEVVAAHVLVIGCYLLEPGYRVDSRRRLFAAGALLALACLLRIQIAPAVALLAIWSMWRDWRIKFPPILAGGLLVVALGALLDWVTLGAPLASIWRNVLYNLGYGVSDEFGTEPWHFLIFGEIGIWGASAPVIVLLWILGLRRLPTLMVPVLTVIAVHACIAHKEYRFGYPDLVLIMVLVGVGLARLSDGGYQQLSTRGVRRSLATLISVAVLLSSWCLAASAIWTSKALLTFRYIDHDNLLATHAVARIPRICGIGLYGLEGHDWGWYGGYSHLHRPVPLYWPTDAAELEKAAPAFNVLIYLRTSPPPDLDFSTLQCFGDACIARRPGVCDRRPMAAMPFPDPIARLAPPREKFEALPARPVAAAVW